MLACLLAGLLACLDTVRCSEPAVSAAATPPRRRGNAGPHHGPDRQTMGCERPSGALPHRTRHSLGPPCRGSASKVGRPAQRAWNLHRFASSGVAGLAVPHLEGAEPRSSMWSPRASASFYGVEEGVDHKPAIPLGDSWSDCIGDLLNEVGFGHPILLARSLAKSCRLLYRNLHGGLRCQLRPAARAESGLAGDDLGRGQVPLDDRTGIGGSAPVHGIPIPGAERVIAGVITG